LYFGYQKPEIVSISNDLLPRQESNLDSSDPESDVLPVTPQGNRAFPIYEKCERKAIGKMVNLKMASVPFMITGSGEAKDATFSRVGSISPAHTQIDFALFLDILFS